MPELKSKKHVSRPDIENICAVIVTYNPDNGLPVRIEKIASPLKHVVVVDNGSQPDRVEMLHALCRNIGAHLILNVENLGIATALNQAAEWAIAQNFDWLLSFDQDTLVDTELVAGLQSIYDDMENKGELGILASNFRYQYGKYWQNAVLCNDKWQERRTVITSGSLLSLAAFCKAGRFRDDFFIDLVDSEYCLRLRSHGYRIYISEATMMIHTIGAKTFHKILWMTVSTTNHSALRNYYVARNRLILIANYLWCEPIAVCKEIKNIPSQVLAIVFYEDNKFKKIWAVILGMKDALLGRMGKFDSNRLTW